MYTRTLDKHRCDQSDLKKETLGGNPYFTEQI